MTAPSPNYDLFAEGLLIGIVRYMFGSVRDVTNLVKWEHGVEGNPLRDIRPDPDAENISLQGIIMAVGLLSIKGMTQRQIESV